jgi:hypothetical protein
MILWKIVWGGQNAASHWLQTMSGLDRIIVEQAEKPELPCASIQSNPKTYGLLPRWRIVELSVECVEVDGIT